MTDDPPVRDDICVRSGVDASDHSVIVVLFASTFVDMVA
jgi:hypothetical protein